MSTPATSSPAPGRQRLRNYALGPAGVGRRTPDRDPSPPAEVPSAEDADRMRALELEVEQLRTAMASRAAIEQAKGVLMVLTGCGEQAAFDLLTHMSSHTHRKVREVAQEITGSAAGRTRLPDDVRRILHDACPPARPMP